MRKDKALAQNTKLQFEKKSNALKLFFSTDHKITFPFVRIPLRSRQKKFFPEKMDNSTVLTFPLALDGSLGPGAQTADGSCTPA